MGIESIQAVQSRITEIQQRIGGVGGAASMSSPGSSSFAGVLREAMASPVAISNATAGTAGGGARPPAGLEAVANGRIPEQTLTAIGPGERLWGPAAEAFRRMAADAQAAGVGLRVTDSYRSYDEQVDVVRRKGLYSQGGLGAAPGTSTHGWALSVDVDTSGNTLAWLRMNAGRYGFVEDVPREPWHWTYNPPASSPVRAAFDPAGLRLPR